MDFVYVLLMSRGLLLPMPDMTTCEQAAMFVRVEGRSSICFSKIPGLEGMRVVIPDNPKPL
jgi:hypothetical protein